MRTIKFRVFEKYPDERFDIWDSASGDWRLEFDEGHKIQLMIWHYEQERWIQSENVIEVYEFTGLKDKNGKEIYEGDKVLYKEVIPSKTPLQKVIQGADVVYLQFIGTIIWDEEGASFDIDGGEHGYRGFGARGTVEMEIIGNIYENPELVAIPQKDAFDIAVDLGDLPF